MTDYDISQLIMLEKYAMKRSLTRRILLVAHILEIDTHHLMPRPDFDELGLSHAPRAWASLHHDEQSTLCIDLLIHY